MIVRSYLGSSKLNFKKMIIFRQKFKIFRPLNFTEKSQNKLIELNAQYNLDLMSTIKFIYLIGYHIKHK